MEHKNGLNKIYIKNRVGYYFDNRINGTSITGTKIMSNYFSL